MARFKKGQFPYVITFILLISSCLPSTVRSDHNHVRSLSESDYSDICSTGVEDSSASCPINCFRADPVCGANGVTYWCGCPDAHCAGTRVVKTGACQVGNGGSGQALLLVHIIWPILIGIFVLFGLL
ncbi:protease inhibitor [Lithospermum erythrorhizon]|uniref:Protease inhibitor n=1 Tax=Lithospermum erythrorhizon TaxID=34254 RepID=A0AAV3RIR6_LITER